jgi:DNA helicase-2/ATP-dependent DNA helicase PcrA
VLTFQEFVHCVRQMPRFQQQWLNTEQEDAVSAPLHPPTFIVAGPGTGKTTALALRTLKLILVDGVPPNAVIATTFTRKAAAELRSRILAWGYATVTAAAALVQGDPQRQAWLNEIDINAVEVGTLDSLSEQFLADTRPPGGITPATIEAFLARAILRRRGLFPQQRYSNLGLEQFIICAAVSRSTCI